jgi:hypothetical protein
MPRSLGYERADEVRMGRRTADGLMSCERAVIYERADDLRALAGMANKAIALGASATYCN